MTVFIEGLRTRLRPLTNTDIGPRYLGWVNDYEVTKYLVGLLFPVTEGDLEGYLSRFEDSKSNFAFAIIDKESDVHIGNVTLNHINWIHRTADTGIMIDDKSFWGNGYASEAWALVVDYAFNRLGLRKLTAGVVSGNRASLKALQNLGFVIEGEFKEEVFMMGELRDVYRLGLIRGWGNQPRCHTIQEMMKMK